MTLNETFLWSPDGTKQVINTHSELFQNTDNSFMYSTTSPAHNNAIIMQKYIDDGQLDGCEVFHLDFSDGQLSRIASGIITCDYSWLPDGRYASVTYDQEEVNNYVDSYIVFDAQQKKSLYTHKSVGRPTWSPNGKYYSYYYMKTGYKKPFTFDINTYELQGNGESVFSYSGGMPISERIWSIDSQFLLFRENRNFSILDLNTLTTKRMLNNMDVSPKYEPIAWWSPVSNDIFFTAVTNKSGEFKNGILWLSPVSGPATLIADLPKFSDFASPEIKTSPDNQYTAFYVHVAGGVGEVITLLDNEMKTATAQLEIDPEGPAIELIWLK